MTDQTISPELPALDNNGFKLFPFFKRGQAAFVIIVLAIVFYSPSFKNEYALDDGILIHQNSYVLKGVKGIGDILTHDAYSSFYERMNATDQLQGGRYRPIASISYALEQEAIGTYRTGRYMFVEDRNQNGVLDVDRVDGTDYTGKRETNYEYNDYVDANRDGAAQPNECYNCWDLNKNFANEASEDLNVDGVFNEIDCQTYQSSLRHFDNIILYALCCLLLYILLSKHLFPKQADLAFLAALLFTIHPVHSEVVANVRGRDDLFGMIFLCLSFISVFNYLDHRKVKDLVLSGLFIWLALLSKEYALTYFILLPLLIWTFRRDETSAGIGFLPFLILLVGTACMVSLDIRENYFFGMEGLSYVGVILVAIALLVITSWRSLSELKPSAIYTVFSFATLFYIGMRLNAVKMAPGVPDTELLNNPFLLASPAQAIATKLFLMAKGLQILIWPHPLISDYSYNSIPYKELSDPSFLGSAFGLLSLFVLGIFFTSKRHVLGFAIISYLILQLVTSNILFPTGIMFLESHLFHASIAFCIALAWLIYEGLRRYSESNFNTARMAMIGLSLLLIVPSAMKSWERSKDWKNDITLFLKDVNNAPNSVLVLGNAGARWIDLADTKEITGVNIPGQDSTRFNDYNGTLHITDEEVRQGGFADKREAALNKGIGYLKHAVELHPRYVNGFLNLGLAYFKLGKEREAIIYWKLAERLYPNNPYLNNYYQVFCSMLEQRGRTAMENGEYKTALIEFNKWTLVRPTEPDAWAKHSMAARQLHLYNMEKSDIMKVYELAPDRQYLNRPNSELQKTNRKKEGC